LLQFIDKDTRHRGEYKTHPNHVAAFGPDGKMLGIVFETSSPFDTPFEMRKLLDSHLLQGRSFTRAMSGCLLKQIHWKWQDQFRFPAASLRAMRGNSSQ
jgi:hypothetical protein